MKKFSEIHNTIETSNKRIYTIKVLLKFKNLFLVEPNTQKFRILEELEIEDKERIKFQSLLLKIMNENNLLS